MEKTSGQVQCTGGALLILSLTEDEHPPPTVSSSETRSPQTGTTVTVSIAMDGRQIHDMQGGESGMDRQVHKMLR